jgi:flagellar hook-length control protein FliK
MPEILPVSVPMPAAPAAGVAPAAPVALDAAPADFIGQLAAALKGLKGIATAVKAIPSQPATPAPATDIAPQDGTPAAAAKPATPTDDVTELMASLGLVLLPQPQAPVLHADAPAAEPTAPITAVQQALVPQAVQAATAKPAPDAKATEELAAKLPPTPVSHELARHVAENVLVPKPVANAQTAGDQPQPAIPAAATQPLAQHTPAPQPVAPGLQPHMRNESGAFQQPAGGQEHHHTGSSTKSQSIDEVALRTESVPQPAFADAALTSTAPVASAAAATPQAVDVASQIAHQVDLYRLPGSKGVRIQLHPEDLGGVQVTVRYGTGGSLELHVNVEHAATGTLVQDGLNHLRDALATHGFEPDRIVMSVTAPSAASQMDFNSNGNGSYRSDPGMTAFTQDGQSGQPRSDQDDPRGPRGWSSALDSDDTPHGAPQSASGTSVIDYRV